MTRTAQRSGLSDVDRCDRCGSQAYVRVGLAYGAELLFCAHHGRQHGDRLREVATFIQDESDRLIHAGNIAEVMAADPDGRYLRARASESAINHGALFPATPFD